MAEGAVSESAKRGAHQYRPRRKVTQHLQDVPREGGDAIIAVFGPVRLAMAAKVDRDRLPSTLGDCGGRSSPGSAGLTASVEEHHGWRKWIAEAVSNDTNSATAVGAEQVR